MATRNGTHCEFEVANMLNHDESTVVRTFSSEVNALRSAVKNGNGYVFMRFGETLGEALRRVEAGSGERLPDPVPASKPRTKRPPLAPVEFPGVPDEEAR